MKTQLTFWAQNLDNTSPDFYALHGNPLDREDHVRRREVVDLVSGITADGVEIYDGGRVAGFLKNNSFILKIYPVELDNAGRKSPIVCHGVLPEDKLENWIDDSITDIKEFARLSGRTVPEQPLRAELGLAIDALKKNRLIGHLIPFVRHFLGRYSSAIIRLLKITWVVFRRYWKALSR